VKSDAALIKINRFLKNKNNYNGKIYAVRNEDDNIAPLILELERVRRGRDQELVEVIFVDDHSEDQTSAILQRYTMKSPWLKVIRLNRQSGQNAALRYGVKRAEASLIVTLDGDDQNDPGGGSYIYNEQRL
jgi:dolichol-phosphate mannosyltransferase